MKFASLLLFGVLCIGACVSTKKAEDTLLKSGKAAEFCATHFPPKFNDVAETTYVIKAVQKDHPASVERTPRTTTAPVAAPAAHRTTATIRPAPCDLPDTLVIERTRTLYDSAAVHAQRVRAEKAERALSDSNGAKSAFRTGLVIVTASFLIFILLLFFIKIKT